MNKFIIFSLLINLSASMLIAQHVNNERKRSRDELTEEEQAAKRAKLDKRNQTQRKYRAKKREERELALPAQKKQIAFCTPGDIQVIAQQEPIVFTPYNADAYYNPLPSPCVWTTINTDAIYEDFLYNDNTQNTQAHDSPLEYPSLPTHEHWDDEPYEEQILPQTRSALPHQRLPGIQSILGTITR